MELEPNAKKRIPDWDACEQKPSKKIKAQNNINISDVKIL